MGRTESGIYMRKQQKRKILLQNERSTNKQIRKDLKN